MLEEVDLQKSGDLMKEIVKGQQQFFNDGQARDATAKGKESPGSVGRSPAKARV